MIDTQNRFRALHNFSQPSTRRPSEYPATQQVHMNMEHRLAAVGVAIHHHPVAIIRDAVFRRDLPGGKKQLTKNLNIAGLHIIQGGYALLWNDQHV
jgi:hypothetical protein